MGVEMNAPDITALMFRCVAAAYPAKRPICLSGTKLWVSPRSEHNDGERASLVSLPGVDPQPHSFSCRSCKRSEALGLEFYDLILKNSVPALQKTLCFPFTKTPLILFTIIIVTYCGIKP
jgi:hypothetical protein